MRFMTSVFLTIASLLLAACGSGGGGTTSGSGNTNTTAKPGHVFVVVLENKGYDVTFGSATQAPYLARTLTAQGALLRNYYGIAHNSLGNYIAMISGQAPNPQTQADCQIFSDWLGLPGLDGNGQATGTGCVYPASVSTLAGQLESAHLSWKGYMEDMGNDLARDGATACAHPALNSQDKTQSASATDGYAARHNPFVYFHSIIDDASNCARHVVNLNQLDADLASVASTANFTFITPNLCNDAHDSACANGDTGGLVAADKFLQTLVPKIVNSPAFRQDGLLVITFDESDSPQTDSSACCNETAGPNSPLPGISGPGGGRTGAVLLSPFIKPGTVSDTPYNHYSLLRSVEDLFGLNHLGFAAARDLQSLGSDVFNQ